MCASQMRQSFSLLHATISEGDGTSTSFAEYDRLNQRAIQLSASNSELFSNSIEFANQRAIIDRVIETGRQHFDRSTETIEALHGQLESVKQQAVEQLRRAVETRVRDSETNIKGLALEVAAARENIDCIGFRRYGGAWSNVTGRPSSKRAVSMANQL